MSKNKASAKPQKGPREFFRKFFVSLKRSPQNIAMVVLAAAFVIYSLNLTSIANTTARINLPNMGQCEFAAMLFSILAFVVFLRAFPKRQKANKIMLALLFLMFALLVFADLVYLQRIQEALNDPVNPLEITVPLAYVAKANNAVVVHIICIGITALLVATLPLYGKALRAINTSIDVEGNGEMEVIDISGED